MSVVIPCYNEVDSIDVLHQKAIYITNNYDIEIIILNNGSNDGTEEKLNILKKNKKIKILNLATNKGYGYGIKNGLKECNGKYVGWTHGDLQTDLFDLIQIYSKLEQRQFQENKKFLVFKGVRYGRPITDRIISKGMSLISTFLFFPLPIYEVNAQPSIFYRSIINVINKAPNGYEFDIYVFIKALKIGFKPIRIPVLFLPRKFGKSHWNVNLLSKLKFIKNTFFYLIKLSFF